MSRWVLLAALLLSGCVASTGSPAPVEPTSPLPRPSPLDLHLASARAAPFEPPEDLRWAYDAARSAVPGLEPDQRLARAARVLANQLASQGRAPTRSERQHAALDAGVAEPVQLTLTSEAPLGARSTIAAGLAESVASRCRAIHCNRVGIARWEREGREHVLALAMSSRLELAPIPLLAPAGRPISLAGAVGATATATEVLVATPLGRVETVFRSSAREFDIEYEPSTVGPHRFEVVATIDGSPTVLAMVPVCVGCRQLETSPARPDGSTTAPDAARGRITALINKLRAGVGLPTLEPSPGLTAAAQAHADEMRAERYFSHRDRRGGGPADRVVAAGLDAPMVFEDLALAPTAEDAFVSLLESPIHLRALVHPNLSHIGVGVAAGDDGLRVVALMARLSPPLAREELTRRVVEAVGAARAERSAPPLQRTERLDDAARAAVDTLHDELGDVDATEEAAQEAARAAVAARALPAVRAVIVTVERIEDLGAVEPLLDEDVTRAGFAARAAGAGDPRCRVVVLLAP